MASGERNIWFPAKRHGWGWGLPCRWQGWVFLVAWAASVIFEMCMIAVLLIVCWVKGEKPGWHRGGK